MQHMYLQQKNSPLQKKTITENNVLNVKKN